MNTEFNPDQIINKHVQNSEMIQPPVQPISPPQYTPQPQTIPPVPPQQPINQAPTNIPQKPVGYDQVVGELIGGFEPTQEYNAPQQPINPEPVAQPTPVYQEPVQQPVNPEPVAQPTQSIQQPVSQEPAPEPVVQEPIQTTPINEPVMEQGPLDSIIETFTPNVDEKKIIALISPADYDNMVKILQVLNKENNDDSITIKQSSIRQGQTDCIIEANIQEVLKNKNGEYVDLDIINPKKYIKLLEQFKSQDDIWIIRDNENSRFIVTNGEVRLFLPQQLESIVNQDAQTFDMNGAQTICQFEVDKDIRKIVKSLSKDQDYIDYLIQDNLVKAIHIPDTAIYIFPEYKNDPKAQTLDETNPDFALRSSNFLPVDSDNYTVYIIKLKNDKYASIADCKNGKISIRTTEICDLATGGNALF